MPSFHSGLGPATGYRGPCNQCIPTALHRPAPAESIRRPVAGRRSLTCAAAAAAAVDEGTASETLQAASKQLSESLHTMDNLVPEVVERTNPELQDSMAVLKEHHEHSTIKLSEHDLNGYFDTGLNTSTNLTDEGCVTLGILSFQQFGPSDCKVQFRPGYWLEQGELKPNSYSNFSIWDVVEGEHAGVAGYHLLGGVYETDKERPYRQRVHFDTLKMLPVDTSEEGLVAWKAAFQEANPDMDENGHISKHFSKPILGWRDFVLIDDKLHITVGNRGAVVIVRRADKPAIIDRLSFD